MLTPVEVRTLELFAIGLRTKQIACLEWVTVDTVKERTKSARRKLGAKNTTHAVALAWRQGLVQI